MILALIALNAAANSFSQPLPDVLDQELEDRLYSSADLQVRPDGAIVIHPGGVHLVLKPEGGYEYRTFDSNPFITGPGHGGPDSPPSQDRDHPAERAGPRPVLGTILFKSDGSVVGYEGKPGQKSGSRSRDTATHQVSFRDVVANMCRWVDYAPCGGPGVEAPLRSSSGDTLILESWDSSSRPGDRLSQVGRPGDRLDDRFLDLLRPRRWLPVIDHGRRPLIAAFLQDPLRRDVGHHVVAVRGDPRVRRCPGCA